MANRVRLGRVVRVWLVSGGSCSNDLLRISELSIDELLLLVLVHGHPHFSLSSGPDGDEHNAESEANAKGGPEEYVPKYIPGMGAALSVVSAVAITALISQLVVSVEGANHDNNYF